MLGYCLSLEGYCFVFGWSILYCFRVIKDNTIFQLGAVLLRVPFRDLWVIRFAPASLIVSQVTFHPSTPRPKVRSNHFYMKYTTNLIIYKIHLSGRHSQTSSRPPYLITFKYAFYDSTNPYHIISFTSFIHHYAKKSTHYIINFSKSTSWLISTADGVD